MRGANSNAKINKREDPKARALKKDRCEAEGLHCECGTIPGRPGLEDCHIHSRRHQSIRHDPRNRKTLCPVHHDFFGNNPKLWKEFVGPELYDELKRLAYLHP